MAWRSLVELLPVIKAFQDSHKLEDIFFLSEFLRNAFVPDGYTPDIGWEHAVSLSEVGRAFVERVPDVHNKYTPPTIHAAVFAHLYHHELLIDPANTDTAHIRRIINSQRRSKRLILVSMIVGSVNILAWHRGVRCDRIQRCRLLCLSTYANGSSRPSKAAASPGRRLPTASRSAERP